MRTVKNENTDYIYHDKNGYTATIEKECIKKNSMDTKDVIVYRLTISCDYNNDFIHHISVHENKLSAFDELSKHSNDEWE